MLQSLREKLNLTQEELAQKSGLSVRTIQRVEAGKTPKGYTLKVLAKTLNVDELELKEQESKSDLLNDKLIKLINLSCLPFVFIPIVPIVVPLLIMSYKNQFNSLTKQIVSLQILWTILSVIGFYLTLFLEEELLPEMEVELILVFLICSILFNVFIILRNTVELDKRKKLYFKLSFNII
jgi:transcriptional regulator with XRE-family HTH domain